ncbi:MAG: hypothetical protein HDS99_00120 [Bacteroidales bacterium]|nr:hypothetical protein [Bacteroidales bacterium]MDE6231368.1 hypothetical protein [Muribaculaceae bacterium]
MAKFRLTVTGNVNFSNLKQGDSIIVEAPAPENITGMMVREAVEKQLGKRIGELFSYYNDTRLKKWSVTKI